MSAATTPDIRVATDNTWPYRFEVLPLEQLFIDESYQRPLSRFVRRIADNFDPALVGTLVVSQRGGTRRKLAVVDGQTRLTAMRQLGHMSAPCLVYSGLTREQEADLFARFQSERKNVSALERFRAALVAGEERATAIHNVVHGLGFVIDKSNVGNAIVAVKALEDTFDRYGLRMVERVLTVVAKAWRYQHSGANTNEMLRGLAYFIDREEPDDERLVHRLMLIEPGVLHTRAAQLRQGRGHGGKSPSYMAEAIRTEYRRRRVAS